MPLLNEQQQSFLRLFFQELNHNGIEYVVLRGFNELPLKIHNDLDILTTNIFRAQEILIAVANIKKIKIKKVETAFKYAQYALDKSISIDLFEALVKKWIPYAKDTFILQSIKQKKMDAPIINEKNYYYTLLIKDLLTYQKIREEKLSELQELQKKYPFDSIFFNALTDNIFTKRSVKELSQYTLQPYGSKKLRLHRKFHRKLNFFSFFSWAIQRILYSVTKLKRSI